MHSLIRNHSCGELLLLLGAKPSGVLARDKRLRSSAFVRKRTVNTTEEYQQFTYSLQSSFLILRGTGRGCWEHRDVDVWSQRFPQNFPILEAHPREAWFLMKRCPCSGWISGGGVTEGRPMSSGV